MMGVVGRLGKVLGPKGLIKKAQKKLAECDESQKEFYECTILVLEGAVNFMVRYHDYIMNMIEEVEDEYQDSLKNVAKICMNLSTMTARRSILRNT